MGWGSNEGTYYGTDSGAFRVLEQLRVNGGIGVHADHQVIVTQGPADVTIMRGELMKPRIVVLIPAHNEQDYIAETIRGVQAQSRPADRIIVVPNNCRDDDATAAIAAGVGTEVIELHGITGRKAGPE